MTPRPDNGTAGLVAQVMRDDGGRLLAGLIRRLGDFQLAEDSLQDAAESALVHWARNGPPRAPAGWLLQVGGRIGAAAMGAAAMFGFLLRLGLIMVAVLAVRDQPWVELVPLGLTIIITHLGLLFWELRHISSSLAFPGLKPQATPNPYLPVADDASGPSTSTSAQSPTAP